MHTLNRSFKYCFLVVVARKLLGRCDEFEHSNKGKTFVKKSAANKFEIFSSLLCGYEQVN